MNKTQLFEELRKAVGDIALPEELLEAHNQGMKEVE